MAVDDLEAGGLTEFGEHRLVTLQVVVVVESCWVHLAVRVSLDHAAHEVAQSVFQVLNWEKPLEFQYIVLGQRVSTGLTRSPTNFM